MPKRKQTSSTSTRGGKASIKNSTSSSNTTKKKKQQQIKRPNVLRDRWISNRKTRESECFDHLLTDDGKRDLRDLDENEVYQLWWTILSIGMEDKLSNETLRLSIERLLDDVRHKGFGFVNKKCYKPFSEDNVIHIILEEHDEYTVLHFPDLISDIINLAPRTLFTDQDITRRRAGGGKIDFFEGAMHKSDRLTFLHRAVRDQVPFWLLQDIYNAYPKAASLQDGIWGRLPFHFAMNFCYAPHLYNRSGVLGTKDLERMEFLFSKYPSAAGIPDAYYGLYPLHQLYIIWDQLQIMSNNHEDQRKGNKRKAKIVANLAEQFLQVCPIAANTEMPSRGGIPLFFICRRSCMHSSEGYASQMICDLLQAYPEGVFYQHRKMFRGLTPFQLPVSENVSQRLLEQLCQSDQHNTTRKLLRVRDDRNGNTVLHVVYKMDFDMNSYIKAFKTHPSNHVVLRHGLVPVLSQLTLIRNHNGDLPLHMRLKFGSHVGLLEDVKVLVEQGDTSSAIECATTTTSSRDQQQYYPFMLAASREVTTKNNQKRKQQQQPCVSTTFFLLQTFVALRGGLDEFY